MSARKGSNGIVDGQQNADDFLAWTASVKDFLPFVRQGVLSISRLARESNLNRDVFYTNTTIRDVHLPALERRLENEGVLKARIANPATVIMRQAPRRPADEARIKQIQEQHEAVVAENRELKKRLARFSSMEAILLSTGRMPW